MWYGFFDDDDFSKVALNKNGTHSNYPLNDKGLKKYLTMNNSKYDKMVKLNKDLDEMYKSRIINLRQRKINNKHIINKSNEALPTHYVPQTLEQIASDLKNYNDILNPHKKEVEEKELKIKQEQERVLQRILERRAKGLKDPDMFEIPQKNDQSLNPLLSLEKNEYIQRNKPANNPDNKTLNYTMDKNNNRIKVINIKRGVKRVTKSPKSNTLLPLIQSMGHRKVIVERQKIYKTNNVRKDNIYLGENYNPFNFYLENVNRTKRNPVGGLFIH